MNKKLTASIIAIILIVGLFLLTGCGEKQKENKEENKQDSIDAILNEVEKETEEDMSKDISKSKTTKTFSGDYYMRYAVEENGEETEIEVARKDDKIASEMKSAEEGEIRIVQTQDTTYMIMEESKTIMKTDVADIGDFDLENFFDDETSETEGFTIGEEEIDGVKYNYEQFGETKFYYVGNTLKKIVENGETIDIVEYDDKAKDEMFEIPTDYTDLSGVIGD